MSETTTKAETHSEQQARAQLDSIRAMVAALECDYDRLEELQRERDAYEMTPTPLPKEDAAELAALEKAAGECKDRDQAEQRIHEDALSVLVRAGWVEPGAFRAENLSPEEYEILLCTGGPACRIRGELDANTEPASARIEHQDWGTPWTEYRLSREDEETVLTYCRCFFFGE